MSKCNIKITVTTVVSIITILSSFLFCSCLFYQESLDNPENVIITDITSESAVVSWTAVPNAALYEILWAPEGINSWEFQTTVYTKLKLTELIEDETYSVKIFAIPADTSRYTSTSFTVKNFTTLVELFPAGELARPRNVTLTLNAEKTNAQISWDAVEGASYYDIKCTYTVHQDSTQEKTVTISADQTSFIDTGINKYSKIEYCVAARDADFSNLNEKCHWSKTVSSVK